MKKIIFYSLFIGVINNIFAGCDQPLGRSVNWRGCDKSQIRPFIFSNANISDGIFIRANLSQATLYGWAFRANFNNAILRGPRLVGYRTTLGGSRSTWDEADFTDADLHGFDNDKTVLEGYLANVTFNGADLRNSVIIGRKISL